jgi:hypothetical protein
VVAYHGYYGQHMYQPLLVFDGTTGQLITAVLRPGTCHASRGVVPVLRRLVRTIRARWPQVRLEVRADCGFAVPALYTFLEAQDIAYTIGLASNSQLQTLAAPMAIQATSERARTGEKVRLLGVTSYQADSWEHPRRVVLKAEALAKGLNLRFVVTTRADTPTALYHWYTQRGNVPELCIKDLKHACFADRLSCHAFLGQSVPPPARGGLLAPGYSAALAGSTPRASPPAGHPAPPADYDWRLGPHPAGDRLPAPCQQPSRRTSLAPPRLPQIPHMNKSG